jgi:hypothetical protein
VLNTGVVVNAGSKRGRPGQWLVDPIDIVIDSAWADSINSSLNADTSVTVSVENSPSGQPQLWVQNPIGKSSGILETSLILASDYSIIFSAPITNSASGALNLNVIAPWVYLRNNVTTKGSQTYQIAGLVVDVDTTLKSFNSPISIHGNVDSPNTGTLPQQPHRLTVDAGIGLRPTHCRHVIREMLRTIGEVGQIAIRQIHPGQNPQAVQSLAKLNEAPAKWGPSKNK